MGLVGTDERLESNFTVEFAQGILVPILSVALAVVIGGIVILVTGGNPLDAYSQLVQGAFGGAYNISETLVSAIPLMLTGMAVAFAFRTGLFNIGAEGQLYMGAIISSWVGFSFNYPPIVLIPLGLLAGAAGGALWGGIAGTLKAWRGAHEVITTMMLNYVAILLSHFLIEPSPSGKFGPFQQPNSLGEPVARAVNAHLPVIVPSALVPNARLSAALIVALACGVLFWFVLWRTSIGYKLRAVGLNPRAAEYAGINVGWATILAMLIAGALAGLGGMVTIYGLAPYRLTDTFSPGYGFEAIAVALLGKNTATGAILAAVLFGAIEHGSLIMQTNSGVSYHLTEVLEGLIIFFIGADALVRWLAGRGVVNLPLWQRKKEAAA
ncbi:MAG TPA: ABC transporter permease [Chloroflexota bacterium]|nr:ABC transporter permease [Chloroflexota bacterium]